MRTRGLALFLIISNDVTKIPMNGRNKLKLSDRYNPIFVTKLDFGKVQLEEEMLFDSGMNDYVHWQNQYFSLIKSELNGNLDTVRGLGQKAMTAYDQTKKQESKLKAIIPNLKIGNYSLTDFHCYVADDNGSAIGCRLLEYANIIIDWKKKKYWFIERKTRNHNNGFLINSNDEVSTIWDDSPFHKLGLRIGMQVVKVNGNSIDSFTNCELRDKMLSTKIESVELKDGRVFLLN